MGSSFTTLNVDGVPMKTYVAVPDGAGPFPGVVVAQHRGGVDEFIQAVCDRLAGAGYVAASPDLYHRQDDMTFEELAAIPHDDPNRVETMMGKAMRCVDSEVERDMSAVLALLQGHPSVGDAPIGVMGFCGGGRVAYMMAARNVGFRAAAVFHGGSIMVARDGPSPFDQTAQISCPVAGFFGDDDGNPSKDDVAKISAEMDRLDKRYEFHSYPDTGHSFLDFTNAGSYRERSAADAWDKLLVFFDTALKAPVHGAA